MKRAKILRRVTDGKWRVMFRHPGGEFWSGLRAFPTWGEATTFALAEVGLSTTDTKEQS